VQSELEAHPMKEEIEITSLIFPVYRKNENQKEWYRFDTITKLTSIRKNNVIAVGIAQDLPKEVFLEQYSSRTVECSKEEFDEVLKSVIKEIGI
jgi:hypothetical protein